MHGASPPPPLVPPRWLVARRTRAELPPTLAELDVGAHVYAAHGAHVDAAARVVRSLSRACAPPAPRAAGVTAAAALLVVVRVLLVGGARDRRQSRAARAAALLLPQHLRRRGRVRLALRLRHAHRRLHAAVLLAHARRLFGN